MISKERLEELRTQNTTVYGVDKGFNAVELIEINTRELYYSKSNDNYQYIKNMNIYEFLEEDLFETKECAEWEEEFGLVARTDKLELPEWNSFDNTITLFTSKAGRMCMIQAFIKKESNLGYIEVVEGNRIVFSSNQYTKEEYIKACRHAKSLFLGVNSEEE